jgi:vitamin B12 transporter
LFVRSATLLLVASPALAAAATTGTGDTEQEIEEIRIVETRLAADAFDIGEAVSIDSATLSKIRPVDPEQLLQALPGFSVSRPGGAGGVSEIFLRGAESNFTAVFVDGIRLNNPSNTRGGSFDFSMLGVYEIDRVDVATGAMSAVYGADAMAGVIQIKSAWAELGSPRVFLEAGSASDWRAGAVATFDLGDDLGWSIRASAVDGGNEIEGSSLRLDSFATRLAGRWPGSGSWELNVRRVNRKRSSFPEVSGGPQLAIIRELEVADGDELSIAATSNWAVTESWQSELHLSASRIRDNVAVPAVAPGLLDGQPAFSTITGYERAQLLWVNRLDLPADLRLVSGVDFVTENGSDDGAVDLGFAVVPNAYDLDRSLSSAFAELGRQWSHGLTTTLAVRWDHVGGEGRASGKMGISRAVSENGSRFWGRIGNGFKLPSFFALGNPLFGNPDLIAEKVRNAEIGYTQVFDSGSELILSVYKNRYDDLVDFDFESFTNVNKGRIDVKGLEIRTTLDVSPSVRLQLDGSWSRISGMSGPLRRRPERLGGASLDWSLAPRWHLGVTTRYIGSRLITSIPTGDVNAAGFIIVGANARYEPSARRTFWMGVDNLLDEAYQDAPGFPSPGTRVRLGANLSF